MKNYEMKIDLQRFADASASLNNRIFYFFL